MSTGPEVLAALDKAIQAHRKAHHAAVHQARTHRARRAQAGQPFQPSSVDVPAVEPVGMPAGLPAQDAVTGLYEMGGSDG